MKMFSLRCIVWAFNTQVNDIEINWAIFVFRFRRKLVCLEYKRYKQILLFIIRNAINKITDLNGGDHFWMSTVWRRHRRHKFVVYWYFYTYNAISSKWEFYWLEFEMGALAET